MLKRFISLFLALTLSAALTGCAGTGTQNAGNDPVPGSAEPTQNASRTNYLNEKGEALPITLLSNGNRFMLKGEYDPLYTGVNNVFAGRMFDSLEAGSTAVFSPLSLEIALQVLSEGGDEQTSKALLDALCPGLTREQVKVSAARLIEKLTASKGVTVNSAVIANSAYRINTDFANAAASYFRASVGALDFSDPKAALEEINGWISDNTDGLIEKLVDTVGADTAVIILNALTLKLDWEKPFTALRELTEFHGLKGVENVGMISSVSEYGYASFDEGQMALIPYAGGEYAMAVILPAEGVAPSEAAKALMGRMSECSPAVVSIKMPKVDLDTKLDVLELADKLGISDGVRGIFPNMLDDESAIVSAILHGATLSVTEFGTTASAATAVITTKGLTPTVCEYELLCDRPYAMLIYHVETGAVLFASTVCDVG